MNEDEARALVERCLPRFAAVGLPELAPDAIASVRAKSVATLWAGMGCVYSLAISRTGGPPLSIVAKRVRLPRECKSIGDQRKKDSYDVEAAFYSEGHAERLLAAGCVVPSPLCVERSRGEGVTICMTKLEGGGPGRGGDGNREFVSWLARMHAAFWGRRADEACAQGPGGGLQAQGCYWHLDTRPDEHANMGSSGWMGRLRLAARAIDLRLKEDPLQTVCHGDAKGANIMFGRGDGGETIPLVYDFQYCGKAAATKDLAYFLNVDAYASPAEEETLLRHYHGELSALLQGQGDTAPSWDELRVSFELALCDWRRFTEVGLGGWGDSAANQRVQKLLDRLDGGKALATEDAYVEAVRREFPVRASTGGESKTE